MDIKDAFLHRDDRAITARAFWCVAVFETSNYYESLSHQPRADHRDLDISFGSPQATSLP